MGRDKLKQKIYDLKTSQMIDHIKKSWPEMEMLGIDIDFLIEKMEKDPSYFDKLSERAHKNPENFVKIPENAGTLTKGPDEKKK